MDPKGGKSWISLVLKAFLLSTKNYFVIVMKSAHKMLYKSVHGVVCASAHTLGTFRQSRSLKNCNKNRKKNHHFRCFLDPIVSHLIHQISQLSARFSFHFSFHHQRRRRRQNLRVVFRVLFLFRWNAMNRPRTLPCAVHCLPLMTTADADFVVVFRFYVWNACIFLLSFILFGQCKSIHIKLVDFISRFTMNPGSKMACCWTA